MRAQMCLCVRVYLCLFLCVKAYVCLHILVLMCVCVCFCMCVCGVYVRALIPLRVCWGLMRVCVHASTLPAVGASLRLTTKSGVNCDVVRWKMWLE